MVNKTTPTTMKLSARLKVGHRAAPRPKSRKSVTRPSGRRSTKFAAAPPRIIPMGICETAGKSSRRNATTSPMIIPAMMIPVTMRGNIPPLANRPNATPVLYPSVNRKACPMSGLGEVNTCSAQIFVTPSRRMTIIKAAKIRSPVFILSLFLTHIPRIVVPGTLIYSTGDIGQQGFDRCKKFAHSIVAKTIEGILPLLFSGN